MNKILIALLLVMLATIVGSAQDWGTYQGCLVFHEPGYECTYYGDLCPANENITMEDNYDIGKVNQTWQGGDTVWENIYIQFGNETVRYVREREIGELSKRWEGIDVDFKNLTTASSICFDFDNELCIEYELISNTTMVLKTPISIITPYVSTDPSVDGDAPIYLPKGTKIIIGEGGG